MNKKIIVAALVIIFLAASVPLMAEETDYIDLNDYDLDLTLEQRSILKKELTSIVDISGEIDFGMIKIILGELEKDDEELEKDYDENLEKDNFGQGLAQEIKRYKRNNENWTGQGLSNMIKNYIEENNSNLPANNKGKMNKNNIKGNNGKSNGASNAKNNPGKEN